MIKQYIHFSFDDTYVALKDIFKNYEKYESIFENDFFAWLKELHLKYGSVFSLYTFNTYKDDKDYDISLFPNKFAEELAHNADWLKFGFHSIDDKGYGVDEPDAIVQDYYKFQEAIIKASGNCEQIIDRVPRLHYLSGTLSNMLALKALPLGIRGLLAADNDPKRLSYFLDENKSRYVYDKGEYWEQGLLFLKSQLRMELVTSLEEQQNIIKGYTEPKVIEIFTHEPILHRTSKAGEYTVKELCEKMIEWAYNNSYGFAFSQDVYEFTE